MRFRDLALHMRLRHIAASKRPVILGPWRSELGFEVLYWIPFLQWAQHEYGIDPKRCLAISRGGMGALYPAHAHDDLYKLRTVDEVRMENAVDWERSKLQKQMHATPWDKELCAAAARRHKLGRYHTLHPSLMYRAFFNAWEEKESLATVRQHTRFDPLPVPDLPHGMKLPDQFVVCRFYDRFTFPIDQNAKGFVQRAVTNLVAKTPIVMIHNPYFTDDHVDMKIEGPNIINLPQVPPEQNFVLQASVLARANAYIGTYGGVAQWALRYGKPSLSFYTQFKGTAFAHLSFSQQLSAHMNVPFEVMRMDSEGLMQAISQPVPKLNENSGKVHKTNS